MDQLYMRRVLCIFTSLLVGMSILFAVTGASRAQQSETVTRITVANDADRDSQFPSISADGRRIAFSSNADFFNQGVITSQTEIWLYDAQTLSLTLLTTASDNNRRSRFPQISADGNQVVFSSDSDFFNEGIPVGQYELWLYDIPSANLERITTASDPDRDTTFGLLNANGTKIAFHSDSDFNGEGIPDEQFEIWFFDTETSDLTRVTEASAPDRDSLSPILSADGSLLLFTSDSDFLNQGVPQNEPHMWLFDIATLSLTMIAVPAHPDIRNYHVARSMNADASLIAFVDGPDIWLLDRTMPKLTRVTTHTHGFITSYGAELSADGSTLVFATMEDPVTQDTPDPLRDIWLYDVATVEYTRVTTRTAGRMNWMPAINADGAVVAFSSDDDLLGQGIPQGQFEIWRMGTPSLPVLDEQLYLPVVRSP